MNGNEIGNRNNVNENTEIQPNQTDCNEFNKDFFLADSITCLHQSEVRDEFRFHIRILWNLRQLHCPTNDFWFIIRKKTNEN